MKHGKLKERIALQILRRCVKVGHGFYIKINMLHPPQKVEKPMLLAYMLVFRSESRDCDRVSFFRQLQVHVFEQIFKLAAAHSAEIPSILRLIVDDRMLTVVSSIRCKRLEMK